MPETARRRFLPPLQGVGFLAVFFEGWQLFQQYNDKSYSLTDCVSFVVMKQLGIRAALSFDKHFVQAGFEKLP